MSEGIACPVCDSTNLGEFTAPKQTKMRSFDCQDCTWTFDVFVSEEEEPAKVRVITRTPQPVRARASTSTSTSASASASESESESASHTE